MKKYELLKLIEEAIEENDLTIETLELIYNATVHFLKGKDGNNSIKKIQNRIGTILVLENAIKDDTDWEIGTKLTSNTIVTEMYDIKISDKSANALRKAYEEV